ncbi:MAG: PfkB family carbohydrate kinase [Verrucomicrobiota bacterium]|nr:PfkB family carbohydrate kinase [Verrucomicrobiota bacterium]
MIYTITANLLAETTAYYKEDTRGHTHRAQSESFQVGGKGINVAKMGTKLGLQAEALCFPAGNNGQRCLDWLSKQAFTTKPFPQSGETRAGFVVRREGKPETTFLGKDQPMQLEAWQQAFVYLASVMKQGDWLTFSGSIPGWNAALADVVDAFMRGKADTIHVAVDSYGPPLEWFKRQPVDLVKINRKELRTLVGEFTASQLPGILRELRTTALPHSWIISDGPNTLYAVDPEVTILKANPPIVKEVSPVGCGDIVLAGVVAGLSRGSSLRESIALALPLASANAARPDVAEFDPATISPLPLTEIVELRAKQRTVSSSKASARSTQPN